MHKIMIAIIDKSEIFKLGLFNQLSQIAEFELADCDLEGDVLQFVDANLIEVVLLDIDTDRENGLALGKKIVQHFPTAKVIVMSSTFSDDELFICLKSGAAAYIDKNTSVQNMVNTIKKASQGQYPINDCVIASSVVANRVIMQFQELASNGLINAKTVVPLTKREKQILTFVANGDTNKKVAQRLGLSEQTIKNHVSAILKKLNANDRAHAVAIAVHNRWVTV